MAFTSGPYSARALRPESPMAQTAADVRTARLPWPVMVYLFCVVIPIGFQAGPLAMTTLRLFLLVMTVPLMFRLLTGAYGKVFVTDILFTLHIAWATVALAVNNPDQVIQQAGSVGMEFLGGYIIGRAYIRTKEEFLALCRWLVVIVLLLAPFAIFEARTGWPLILETIRSLPGIETFAKVRPDPRLGLFRAQTVFAHAIHHGLFCSIAFSLAFVAMRDQTSAAWRWTSATIIALVGFLGLSSGALLAILLQIALISWAAIFHRLRARWWLLVGLFVLAYIVIDIISNRSPIRVFMSYATFSAHNAYWRGIIFEWGMKNVWANPIFGIGLNDWVRPHFMYSGSMDNFWLVMAVRYGIPGFVLLVTGYALIVMRIMRLDLGNDTCLIHIRRAWVFTFLGLSFTLCTVHIWTNIYSFVFFMLGSGLWLISATPRPSQEGAGAVRLESSLSGELAAAPFDSARLTAQDVPTGSRREALRFSRFERVPTPPADGRQG